MGSYDNQIIGVMIGAILLVCGVIWVAAVTESIWPDRRLPPEAVCPAQWKCVGPPETRATDCKCWDRY